MSKGFASLSSTARYPSVADALFKAIPNAAPDNRITQINVDSARYFGRGNPASLSLGPWLNCVIGGHGTGKSSILEFTRLALGREIRLVGFWQNAHAQTVLRKWIFQFLDAKDVLPIERLQEVADRIVELAKANHGKLSR
jgi:hypothetical protein